MPTFLQQKLKAKTGDVIIIPKDYPEFNKTKYAENLDFSERLKLLSEPYFYSPDAGKIAGKHQGAHFYTIGQRKGLGIGGLKEPPFVLDIDVENNIVYIGEGKQHPGLYRKALFVKNDEIHWIRPDLEVPVNNSLQIFARIRYRQPLQKATLYKQPEGIYLLFEKEQRGITSGQFAAFYINDELIGSGIIS